MALFNNNSKSESSKQIFNKEFYKVLLQYSYDSFVILDEYGKVAYQIAEYGKITGIHQENLIGKSFMKNIHIEDKEKIKKVFQDVLINPGKKFEFECRLVKKNKKIIYTEGLLINELLNSDINGILLIARELSKKQIAEKYEQEFAKYQEFLSNTALNFLEISNKTDIYAFIGKNINHLIKNSIVFVHSYSENDKMLKIEYTHGINKDGQEIITSFVKKPGNLSIKLENKYYEILHSGNLIELKKGLRQIPHKILNDKLIGAVENRLNLKTVYLIGIKRKSKLYGTITILCEKVIPIQLFKVIETFMYQSAIAIYKKEIEEELIIEKRKAEEADRLKSTFLANISHEIRTPMNGIIGFSQLLNDTNITPEKKDNFIKIIDSNSQLLMSLINDIIDISKIEARQLKLNYTEFNINEFLNDLYYWAIEEKQLKNKDNVEIKLDTESFDMQLYLFADQIRLKQVFINLIGNAIKFTENGLIEFGFQKIEDENGIYDSLFRFYVKDTGIGIEKSYQKIIFDRFRQVDEKSDRKFGGTGLGLAISKNLIELMGGKIWFNSNINQGSVFYFTIPQLNSKEEIKLKRKKTQLPQNIIYTENKNTILIIEPDKTNVLLLKELLGNENITYVVSQNGLQAINIIQSNKLINLVLLDLNIPYIDGFELIKKIKKINKELPIIVQTADAYPETRTKVIKLGGDDFITKPIKREELNKLVSKYLVK
ncbi:MAG: response regulator [Chlorobi bacterium]|nr:response regulator [Chlorobiota bacterium]